MSRRIRCRRMARAFRPAGCRRTDGFTLIEVVIAMTIIAILTAIALPAYTQYVQRGHRSEARATLMQAAQWMERFRTQSGSYAGAALPATFEQSPPPPTAMKYDITVASTASTYTLSAIPAGTMVGDACGTFTLDQSGARAHTGAAPGELCWGR